ncbi:hypothetical protein EYF80_066062 [Liparis tanakae]|uniref:Uncharacterized protein n=1 Tax=Liparis tanakae TaxID=230148 RepID=A0A4Z2E4H4_9TELE|nr:hypothetical protein EYF80_066062 [Liparis tanakae]
MNCVYPSAPVTITSIQIRMASAAGATMEGRGFRRGGNNHRPDSCATGWSFYPEGLGGDWERWARGTYTGQAQLE